MKINCFIIHLQRADGRLKHVNDIKSKCPIECEVVYAVDGSLMDDEYKSAYQKKILTPYYPFELRLSEIAAFHSHRKCWQKILDQKLDAALILEDDVEFEPLSLKKVLDFVVKFSRANDYIRLPHRENECMKEILMVHENMKIYKAKEIALGAQAQVVTSGAAQKLLELTKSFDRPIDTYLQMRWIHKVPVLSVRPSCISEISSHLGGSTIQKRTPLITKLRREINRFIYRRKISILS